MSYKEEDIVDIYTNDGTFFHKGIKIEGLTSVWTPPRAIRYIPKRLVDYCLKKGIDVEFSLVAHISRKKRYYKSFTFNRILKNQIYHIIASVLRNKNVH